MAADITQKSGVIAIVILTSIYVLIFTPVSLYFSRTLLQLNAQNIPFITKRHAKIVIFSIVLLNIYPTIIRPITDLTRLYQGPGKDTRLQNFWLQFVQFPAALICVRLWLLFFDYTSELQTLRQKWKSQITKEQNAIPWTARYQWMGNSKILAVIATIFAFILLAVFVFIVGNEHIAYLQTIPALVYAMFILIMMIKIHKCRDEFYIRKEFLAILLWFVIVAVVYYALITPLVPRDLNIRIIVINIFTAICIYVITLISTYWVIRKYDKQHAENLELQHSISVNHNSADKHLSLEQILSKQDWFDIFADHLVGEFAIENLTFVFEVMQIKHEAIKNKLIIQDDAGVVIAMTSQTLNKVRRKHERLSGINELKESIKFVVSEYIYQNAQLCVNISSKARMYILKTFNELEQQKVHDDIGNVVDRNLHALTGTNTVSEVDKELTLKYISLFDTSIKDILFLMQLDSLSRFYRSKTYQIMVSGK